MTHDDEFLAALRREVTRALKRADGPEWKDVLFLLTAIDMQIARLEERLAETEGREAA